MDIDTFRTETSVKYPTFDASTPIPPPLRQAPISRQINPSVLTSRLAKAYSPIPVRHHYNHDTEESMNQDMGSQFTYQQHQQFQHQQQLQQQLQYQQQQHHQQQQQYRPQPATPAPSPPPSPKPKKQQYQTDQSRPFLFPFSKGQTFGKDSSKLVPFAIDEADKLYNKHMYVSLALAQMWRTREDCMTAESGLERMPGAEPEFRSSTFNPVVSFFLF